MLNAKGVKGVHAGISKGVSHSDIIESATSLPFMEAGPQLQPMVAPMYHITRKENLDSIMFQGLKSHIGANSEFMGEDPAVFLFKSVSDMRHAMFTWLNICFEETDELVSIEVDVEGLDLQATNNDYEMKCVSNIDADRLSVYQDEHMIEYNIDEAKILFDEGCSNVEERNLYVLTMFYDLLRLRRAEYLHDMSLATQIARSSELTCTMTKEEALYRLYFALMNDDVYAHRVDGVVMLKLSTYWDVTLTKLSNAQLSDGLLISLMSILRNDG